MLPNLFILGGQKCGTTSVFKALTSHFDVYIPRAKEAHIFNTETTLSNIPIRYQRFFKDWNGEHLVGDATPNYLSSERAAVGIETLCPDAKLVVILRNPIDRAYSAYWHACREGAIRTSFEDALDKEKYRASSGDPWSQILYDGCYFTHLSRYKSFFNKDRVTVIVFEELITEPSLILNRLADDLGIQNTKLSMLNATNVASRSWLPLLLRSLMAEKFKSLHERTLSPFTPPPMSKTTRAKLRQYYSQDIRLLHESIVPAILQWWESDIL